MYDTGKKHKVYNNTHIVLNFDLKKNIIQFISKAFAEK